MANFIQKSRLLVLLLLFSTAHLNRNSNTYFINNTKHIISFFGKECKIEILSINHLLFYSSHLCFSDKKTACQGIGDKYTNTTGDNFKIKYYINNEHKEAIYDGIACSITTATWMG